MFGVSPGDGQLLQRSIFLTHAQGLGSAASILFTQEGLEGRSLTGPWERDTFSAISS